MLRAILSPDNTARKQQEVELQALRMQHPNELVLCLLAALRQVPDVGVRTLSAVLMRQMVTALHASTSALWSKLSPAVKAAVKGAILEAARSESDKGVRKRVGDLVGELGATVLTDEADAWPELLPFLFQMVAGGEPSLVASALHIFAGLFTFVHETVLQQKPQIFQIFASTLSSPSIEVKVSATEALSAFLSVIDMKEISEFKQLTQPTLLSAYSIIEHSEIEGKEVMESLVTIAETEAKFFYESFEVAVEFMERVFALNVDFGVKSLAVEMIVCVAERKHKLMSGNQALCQRVLEKIFRLMLSVDKEVDETWLRPPEGYKEREDEDEDEDEIEIDYAKIGRKIIQRLLEALGDIYLLPLVIAAIQNLLQDTSDWRSKYAALMTTSQLGQFIGEPDKIAGLIPILTAHCGADMPPKIRYAVFHCIEHLSEDLGDDFKEPHHVQLTEMLNLGLSDAVPRVVAQAIRAVGEFFSSCSQQIAHTYSAVFLPRLSGLIVPTTPSIVIENALTAIAAISEANKEEFAANYEQLVPFLISLIRSYTATEYKQLRGKAIECLTFMCSAVGRKVFAPRVTEVVSLLREIQESQLGPNDPQVSYLLSAWQRLCVALKSDFSTYLPHVVPGLLAMAAVTAAGSIDSSPADTLDLEAMLKDEKKGKVSVSTSDTEDKVVALETLLTIVESMKGDYFPFVEKTIHLVLPLVNYTINEDIRAAAAGILAALLTTVRLSPDPEAIQKSSIMGKVFLNIIHPALVTEFEADTMVVQLQAVKSIVEVPGTVHMTAEEVLKLGQEMVKLLERSLEKRKRNEAIDKAVPPDSDDDEASAFGDLLKSEEDRVHTSISEVFGALFRTHTEFSIPIVKYLYDNVLRMFVDPAAREEDHKFGVYLIDDIIEFVGPTLVPDQWPMLSEAILKYAVSHNDAVRQAACYGLGILATRTDPAVFGQWSESILKALSSAIAMPVGKASKSHGHARDNAIAAIGRILKHQTVDTTYWLPYWAQLLPIRHDKMEARLMHEQFAAFVMQNSQLVLKPEGAFHSLLPHIVKVFGEILDTKVINPATVPMVKTFFQQLKASELSALPELWAALPDLHRKRISALLEG